MIRHLLHVDFDPHRGLQEQVRETLINAILSGFFAADTPLPSCRQLASQLRVSRNTTALVLKVWSTKAISSAGRAAGSICTRIMCSPLPAPPCKVHRRTRPLHHAGAPGCR